MYKQGCREHLLGILGIIWLLVVFKFDDNVCHTFFIQQTFNVDKSNALS